MDLLLVTNSPVVAVVGEEDFQTAGAGIDTETGIVVVEGEEGEMDPMVVVVVESVIEVRRLSLAVIKEDRVLAVRQLEIAITTIELLEADLQTLAKEDMAEVLATIARGVSLLAAPEVLTVMVPTTVEGEKLLLLVGAYETGAVPEALNIAAEVGDVLAVHPEVGTMIMITVVGIVEEEVQIMPLVATPIARTVDTVAIKAVLFFACFSLKLLNYVNCFMIY